MLSVSMDKDCLRSPRRFYRRGSILFAAAGLSLLLFHGTAGLLLSKESDDPIVQREDKLKAFRQQRDRFFREDDHSPLRETDRKNFKGLLYYPIDLKYAVAGTLERYSTSDPVYVTLPTNRESGRRYVRYGRFKFKWEGREQVLEVYRPLGGGELFLPFKDGTSGQETFSRGRYLYIEPLEAGKVLIDFNRAYNPFCHYNEKYTCPFAPEENWLRAPIRAGEKRYPVEKGHP